MKIYRQHSFFEDSPEDSRHLVAGAFESLDDTDDSAAERAEAFSSQDGESLGSSAASDPDATADLGDDPADGAGTENEPADLDPDDESVGRDAEAESDAESDGDPDADDAGGITDLGQGAVDAFFGPPRLDRPRLARPPLVPRWVQIGGLIVAVAAIVAFGVVWWNSTQTSISTPQITGVDVATATTRLAEQGLTIAVSDRHFSPKPAGTVLSQVPDVGTKLRKGAIVTVVVSVGTETFSMPDVIGDGALLARGLLETKGLDVHLDQQPSQQPSGTVLASNPPAGKAVHTGDIVRLTVAAQGPTTTLLLPYDMTGVTVLIDPAPVNDALTDVPLDVARRLRSLLEASHGKVVTTRALADTSTLVEPPARADKAAAATPTVAIGLSTQPVGGPGLTVFAPSPVLLHASSSAKLASLIASDFASSGTAIHSATLTTDTVLVSANSPWARVQLGSFSQREDVSKFTDPSWEDTVARNLYKAIAAIYGHKTSVTP